jgi:hypothetical protein
MTINVVIFNILILLLVCIQSIDIMIVNYLGPINMYINIFGIVFATSTPLAAPRGLSLALTSSYKSGARAMRLRSTLPYQSTCVLGSIHYGRVVPIGHLRSKPHMRKA